MLSAGIQLNLILPLHFVPFSHFISELNGWIAGLSLNKIK